MAESKKKPTLKVTQTRSPIGRPNDQRATLVGLGLNMPTSNTSLWFPLDITLTRLPDGTSPSTIRT